MELAAILISVLALGLSGFTFYWTSIREVKELYLIRVDGFSLMTKPEFALLNSGSKDVLITSVMCGFDNKQKNSVSLPKQRIEIADGNSLNVEAGRALPFKIEFLEKFTTSFVLEGEKSDRFSGAFSERDMRLLIEWIGYKGDSHKASVLVCRYGFSDNGEMRLFSPIGKKLDLYEESKRK